MIFQEDDAMQVQADGSVPAFSEKILIKSDWLLERLALLFLKAIFSCCHGDLLSTW